MSVIPPPDARLLIVLGTLDRHCCIQYAKVQAAGTRRAEMPQINRKRHPPRVLSNEGIIGKQKWPRTPGPFVTPKLTDAVSRSGLRGRRAERRRCESGARRKSATSGRWRPEGGRAGWPRGKA